MIVTTSLHSDIDREPPAAWAPDMEKTTFDDLIKIIQDEYRMNERRSMPRMKTALNFLRAHFGMSHARDITLDRLNRYVATRLDAHGAPASVSYELSILRRAFRLAQRAGKAICPPSPLCRCTRSGKASLNGKILKPSANTYQNI